MKKICVVTATRAEYGLLRPLMDLIQHSDRMLLQIIATGTHLSAEFGLTYKQIEADGFLIDEKLEILLSSDTSTGIVKTMGLALHGMAEILPRLKPDILVLLGDRYEMLAIASAATMFKIPIVHIHGGEITEGAYDDAIRHALTKLSHLHFTSTREYRNRVIQMGENPETVFNVGAIGLDNIKNLNLLTRRELESELNITFRRYNYQITFHPETLGQLSSAEQFQILLKAIDQQEDSFFVFTKANADTDGRVINQMIDKYVADNPGKAAAYASLGTLRFLSLVKVCTAIVGNSSSGILEAPSLKTPTINIGDRQRGRLQAASVVNVSCEENEILNAFEVIKTYSFQESLNNIVSPYENGGAAQQILAVIESRLDLKAVKKFHNLI
ncbi:GDP/UDP-N,N'-diacetylbacillosamine 2-epimerase (hydrolyzing) [compost metagenome]|uniref:UDP-N-acetylglucosamine 2-epimerase (Hydrolyzing) n=1 Tax=Sphingobacterium paramultivorum TaxID=2886510 RepID=A0A7G5E725_9SPHI|nr:UDP-N-acetylglucosamine 2-epimerase [Sphingobacterium paramultivorum]QMV69800.1 UDP-N-acetylglucosamine 2-epimerase (hydrolyzing) [Sphingobacterium paramultivorum]WSO13627.1 UDP-N-acetylglucosamine 2-epimerase [Sphingobacterium paramultivorum]